LKLILVYIESRVEVGISGAKVSAYNVSEGERITRFVPVLRSGSFLASASEFSVAFKSIVKI